MLLSRRNRKSTLTSKSRAEGKYRTPKKPSYGGSDWSPPPATATTSVETGSTVWVPVDTEEAWQVGEVIGVDENNAMLVRLASHNEESLEVVVPRDCQVYPVSRAFGREDVDDLTSLKHLHEPALLQVLQNRFNRDQLYTMCGPILLAVNPFKYIKGLYEKSIVDRFLLDPDSFIHTPHVFSTALQAYKGMCGESSVRQGVSQSILISGESGAGKTETTKLVMQFLSACGRASKGDINRQVLESNPLLEAFGNACTLRNDNSSRFGKFIQLQFDGEKDHLRLKGARIETYLLEKIRVTNQIQGERNFHIFYQICAAAAVSRRTAGGCLYSYPQIIDAEGVKGMEIELKGLADHSCFSYLTRDTAVHKLSHGLDLEGFERTVHAMTVIGYGKEGIEHIFRLAAAILRLGNVEFAAPEGDSEASVVINREELALACELLDLDSEVMERALCSKSYSAVDDHCVIPLPVEKAIEQRDALARFLYGLVFTKVVVKTNSACITATPSPATYERRRRQSVASSLADFTDDGSLFCGVLDIFGFEYYKNNTFEQLCINYANERLQGFFVDYVFNHEQQVYHRDGIHWESVVLDYPDNQASIALLDGRPDGLLTLLDEECKVVGGSDENYFGKIAKAHSCDGPLARAQQQHPRHGGEDNDEYQHQQQERRKMFEVVKQKKVSFIVGHFAGPVEYSCDQFLDKNRDAMSNDLAKALGTNKELRRGLRTFRSDSNLGLPTGGAPRKRQKVYTVAGEFRDQLSALMTVLKETNPHFIRCIKPNQKNLPDRFERSSVVDQLRYGGVIQAVEVARNGYPVRISLEDFAQDYWPVLSGMTGHMYKDMAAGQLRQMISTCMARLADELSSKADRPVKDFLFLVGNTKVFLKRPAYEHLNLALHTVRSAMACRIQAVWKGRAQRRQTLMMIEALVKLQRAVKCYVRRIREQRRAAATRIQAWRRKIAAAREYVIRRSRVRRSVALIEAYRLGVLQRRRMKAAEEDELEALSAVNSPSLERTMLRDENSPMDSNDVTRISVMNEDLISTLAIRPYRLSTGSLNSCHSVPCYGSMCMDSGGRCRPAGSRRLSSSSSGSSSMDNTDSDGDASSPSYFGDDKCHSRSNGVKHPSSMAVPSGARVKEPAVTRTQQEACAAMRTPSLSARSMCASPPLAHTPTRGFRGSPPRLGAAPPRRFRQSAANFGFARSTTPLLAHQRIRSVPHGAMASSSASSLQIVQGSLAKHAPATMLGSLVSPTALPRSTTPNFFGPSRPLRAENVSLASPPPIALQKQRQSPLVPFNPPVTDASGVALRSKRTTGFGPAMAYHQQRTAGCSNAPGSHNFRQKLRVPKVPSFHLRTFSNASTKHNSKQHVVHPPPPPPFHHHPPPPSNVASVSLPSTTVNQHRPVVPWIPPSRNRASSIEEWTRLQIRAARRISPSDGSGHQQQPERGVKS